MAIEIRELVIKTTIDNSSGKKGENVKKKDNDDNDIIRECVEQVMDLLRQEKER